MGLSLSFIILFFVYGLSFFCLGVATFLESGRSPLLAEARVLRPLSTFGFLHGIHEWVEMILVFALLMGTEYFSWVAYLRLGLLIFSFLSLIAYSVQVFRPVKKYGSQDFVVSMSMFLIYLVSLLTFGAAPWIDPSWEKIADLLARYVLAVPGAIMAAFALRQQANQAVMEARNRLAKSLKLASVGFLIYGFSQIFVPPAEFFLASVINARNFIDITGFPVQVLRAALAILITYALIRATQIVGRERQNELLEAQQDRVAALEQVQKEMDNRNEMRKELLRRTVLLQEDERIRISRELHDETAQYLTAFSANLAALENKLPKNISGDDLVIRLQNLSGQMAQSLSRLVHDLRPAQLDELGLKSALAFLVERLDSDLGLKVEFKSIGKYKRHDPLLETVLFRVAQEALINVVRHAEINNAELIFKVEKDNLELKIKDNGKGFELSESMWADNGLGLVGMRERVESVEGNFEINTKPGKGTEIIVSVQNKQHKEDKLNG